jgi:hypothetical protein
MGTRADQLLLSLRHFFKETFKLCKISIIVLISILGLSRIFLRIHVLSELSFKSEMLSQHKLLPDTKQKQLIYRTSPERWKIASTGSASMSFDETVTLTPTDIYTGTRTSSPLQTHSSESFDSRIMSILNPSITIKQTYHLLSLFLRSSLVVKHS